MILTGIRFLAASVGMLLVVYAQPAILVMVTPAEHGGVIAASLVGRFLTFGALALGAMLYVMAASAALGLVTAEGDVAREEGCLAMLAGLGFNLAAIAGLTVLAGVLSWRLEHDLGSTLVALVMSFATVGAVMALGSDAGEAAFELLTGG